MPTLRQILALHAPLLVIDAAGATVHVGAVRAPDDARWQHCTEEAGVGIFRALDALGVSPSSVGAYVYCDGPGSILGIRTAAMALRTWRVFNPLPMFAYHTLALIAATEAPGTTVIADARQATWHRISTGSPLSRVTENELPTQSIVTPREFRRWSALPAGGREVPYDPAGRFARALDVDLLRPSEAPDAFLHEEPRYVTWTPQVHQAP